MVGCPVGRALPLASFHGVARDHIYSDTFDVEFQIGMLSIPIDSLGTDPLPNFREDLLRPLLPILCGWKTCKDIQAVLAAQPSVPRERPLNRDVASGSSLVKYVLSLAPQSLSQRTHSFLFSHAGS